MVHSGPMVPGGVMDNPLRLMAERYMAARDLRLSAMQNDKQEEVVDAMREALCELKAYLLETDKTCPNAISKIIDDY